MTTDSYQDDDNNNNKNKKNTENHSEFDPNDEVSYYYGNLTREKVKDILNKAQIGTFLIRDSTKDYDQKVLCVKEANELINSYKIVHKINSNADDNSVTHTFHIYGKEDCLFENIPKILEFYSKHYLNQSPLVKPAFYHKKVLGLYDFSESEDPNEDLYFKKNEILTILEYTQGEHWWKAMNRTGNTGLIPATLVRRLNPNEWPSNIKYSFDEEETRENSQNLSNEEEEEKHQAIVCPFKAKVIEDYTPSPYEHSHIALRKGQIVTVLEMKSIGKWLGILDYDGKRGLFPFNRVEIINN